MGARAWFSLSLVCLSACPVALAYTFGESRSAASTEIFGYDRAKLPQNGQQIRTDAFVAIAPTNKVFRLGDMRVLGYETSATGTAGVFSFYVPNLKAYPIVPAVDEAGRSLEFYWYDVKSDDPALVRAPGWYDADGKVRWDDDTAFKPGQAFLMRGKGLTLETDGQVLDVDVNWSVPHNSAVLVGQGWAKHANLCDISIEGNGDLNVGGGVVVQTRNASLRKENLYPWFDVTHGVPPTDVSYREPGFYRDNTSQTNRYQRADGVQFDMGSGFYVQGYQANEGEPAPDCTFVLPKLEVKMNDYQPGVE